MIYGLLCQLFCKHSRDFVRNFYGDEINIHNGNRSLHQCTKCGAYDLHHALAKEST